MLGDTRGVSVALTHSLTLGITAILVSGLIIAAGGAVETQRERAVEGELTTVGERLATEVAAIDRAANATGSNVTVETSHPDRVVDSTYSVSLSSAAPGCEAASCLVLEADSPAVTVVVPVRDSIEVEESRAPGGELRIHHDGDEVRIGGSAS